MPRRGPLGSVATVPGPSQTLVQAAREYIWLYDLRHGVSIPEIAARAGLSIGAVRAGLKRARAIDAQSAAAPEVSAERPDMGLGVIPLFPAGAFTPESKCPHVGHTPPAPYCCMVCDRCER